MSKFSPGQIVATPGAMEAIGQSGILSLLRRHLNGDWGELDTRDQTANQRALTTGERIFSAYTIGEGEDAVRVWVITEADRSATTVLLPDEY